jgi:hypothetical protein
MSTKTTFKRIALVAVASLGAGVLSVAPAFAGTTAITTSVPTVIDEVEDLGVSLADDSVVVRVAEDLEMMTIGAGNHYSFQAGKKYKVSQVVANHLREKGYLYDRL